MISKVSVLVSAMLKPSVLLVGLLFILVNAHYDYLLYHINTYKILMLGLSVLLLYVFQDVINNNKGNLQQRIASWQAISLIALPTIATFPGYFWHVAQGGNNYNFSYELVTDLFLFLWAGYVFRITTSDTQRLGFFAWIIPLMIFLAGYSILEFYGLNPLTHQPIPGRPKATFGNINYFAGFLATLTPVLLLLSLPKVVIGDTHYSLKFDRVQMFFVLGFIALLICALLAQSRAALGASFVASLIALSLWAFAFLRDKHRTFIIALVVAATAIILLAVGLAAFYPEFRDILIPGRFNNLFEEDTWQGRTSPTIAAARAFIASPWIGWGLGSSYNLNFLFMPDDVSLYLGNRSYNHVHNEFLEMSEEGGVLLLFVWATLMLFIFWKLFKIAQNRVNQAHNRLIAIACMTGIMAFYGHGVFSVAQRMVVANLPFYSLLGVAMGLIYSHSKKQRLYKMPQFLLRLPASVWRFVPSSLLMALAWGLFIPIIISFYQMVRITPETHTLEGIIKMEEHMRSWPNPYALDDLINLQIEHRRYKQAQESAAVLQKIIPEYRTLGYKEGAIYFYTREYEKAKRRLQAYQKYAGYEINSILLLGSVALQTQDQAVFIEQLERLFRREVISRSALDSFRNVDQVRVIIDDSVDDFTLTSIQSQPGSLQFTFSSDYLKRLINVLSNDKKNRQSFMNDFGARVFQQPVLKPPLKDVNDLSLAIELARKVESFAPHVRKQQKIQREAYLRSTRPKTRVEKLNAIRELDILEYNLAVKLGEKKNEDIKQLEKLVNIDNIEDFVTMMMFTHHFIRHLQSMSENTN